MFAYVDRYLPGEKGLVEEAFEDWKIIIEAISRGDAETAAERTRDHIRRFAVHLDRGRQKP
jgi:DNA-binding GntR family transcriptional regulator